VAVGTQDEQVLQPVVVADAVAVVELEGKTTSPPLGQSTLLAMSRFQPSGEEAVFEVPPAGLSSDH
jgi:hypothetical protein